MSCRDTLGVSQALPGLGQRMQVLALLKKPLLQRQACGEVETCPGVVCELAGHLWQVLSLEAPSSVPNQSARQRTQSAAVLVPVADTNVPTGHGFGTRVGDMSQKKPAMRVTCQKRTIAPT